MIACKVYTGCLKKCSFSPSLSFGPWEGCFNPIWHKLFFGAFDILYIFIWFYIFYINNGNDPSLTAASFHNICVLFLVIVCLSRSNSVTIGNKTILHLMEGWTKIYIPTSIKFDMLIQHYTIVSAWLYVWQCCNEVCPAPT